MFFNSDIVNIRINISFIWWKKYHEIINKNDIFKLPYEYLTNKIIIYNVPKSYYILQINGNNILTGEIIKDNWDNTFNYLFDIKKIITN